MAVSDEAIRSAYAEISGQMNGVSAELSPADLNRLRSLLVDEDDLEQQGKAAMVLMAANVALTARICEAQYEQIRGDGVKLPEWLREIADSWTPDAEEASAAMVLVQTAFALSLGDPKGYADKLKGVING